MGLCNQWEHVIRDVSCQADPLADSNTFSPDNWAAWLLVVDPEVVFVGGDRSSDRSRKFSLLQQLHLVPIWSVRMEGIMRKTSGRL